MKQRDPSFVPHYLTVLGPDLSSRIIDFSAERKPGDFSSKILKEVYEIDLEGDCQET